MRLSLLAALLALTPVCTEAQTSPWIEQLGYRPAEVTAVRAGPARLPLVQVAISGVSRWLLFDTGDAVGLSLTTSELTRQELPVDSTYRRLDSGGRVVGSFRRLRASSVTAFGRVLGDLPVWEVDESLVAGLIGPGLLPGSRFTLDYADGLLAITNAALGTPPAGFTVLPLVRSSQHPHLILVSCQVAGRSVLTEFDTGKTRTVIDPGLVRALGLTPQASGVRVDSLVIGPVPFAIPSAKVQSLADIDRSLPTPIELSVGSDVISQLLITVDYATNRLVFRRQSRPQGGPAPGWRPGPEVLH
jgi:hypothetical protein